MSITPTVPLFLSVALFIAQNYVRHQAVETNDQELRHEYDFIVVGSGTAGSVVSARLAENPNVNVLLLEAGGPSGGNTDIPGWSTYVQFFGSPLDWNYTLEEQFVGRAYLHHRIGSDKGIVIGGTSTINTMVYNRGNPRDYDQWESKFGAKGWSYEQVMPYFLKFENNLDPVIASNGFHSTAGPVQVSSWAKPPPIIRLHQKAVREWGFKEVDLNGPSQRGTMLQQACIGRNGVRSSASNSYLDPNPYPHRLHISLNSFVTKILFDGHRAVGVQYLKKGILQNVFAKREVILSAGAFNTPKLLMLSGIGPKQDLERLHIPVLADLPVGMFKKNHPGVTMNMLLKDKYSPLAGDLASSSIAQLNEFYVHGRGPMTENFRAMTYSSSSSNKDPEWPNWNWETGIYLFPQNLTQHWIRYDNQHEWDVYHTPFLGKPYLLVHTLLNKIRSQGSVRLASADPFHPPIINGNWFTYRQDWEDMIEALSETLRFFETSSFSKFLAPMTPIPGCQFCPKGFVYQCRPYLECLIEQIVDNGYHETGTARMGDPRRKDVVVDPRLRVKYTDGLRVCDSSIMPEVPNGNTNAPTLMVGEKCAHIVAQDNRL